MTSTKVPNLPDLTREAGRRQRFDALGTLWRESSLDRVKHCRRHAANPDGLVGVKVSGDRAGFSGLVTCGSVWACPVCSAKIAAHRASEVEAVLQAHSAAHPGGGVVMATFTIQHRRGHSLRALWDALGAAWGRVTSGRGWLRDQEAFGIVGWLRVVEVTHGAHGWHVHIHALLLTSERVSDLMELHGRLYGRWGAALGSAGFAASRRHGVDVRHVDGAGALGRYFAKAVYELTGANLKETRHGNVTPFGLLRLVVEDGDADALDRWHEWEMVSKGRRQLTWSRGLRDLYALAPELDDQEVSDLDDLGGDLVALIDPASWRRIVAGRRLASCLEAAEGGTLAAWFLAHEVAWHKPPKNLLR
jgi:hypothetical protein